MPGTCEEDRNEKPEIETASFHPLAGAAEIKDWVALLKPRVMALVVFIGLTGVLVAPGNLHPALAFTAVLCIAVAAGAAGAINMWYDRDIDALMRRTASRPIPAGRIAAGAALCYGVTLATGAVLVMFLATNLAAASLLALSILFYVFVYTIWLKRHTPQNIVIGGAAGAFPPVIGWAAVTGSVDVIPLILFAIVFFWTPPHFWSLALFAHEDYARAGVPMLPVVVGVPHAARIVLWSTVALALTSLLPVFFGAGPVYFAGACIGGGYFTFKTWRLSQAPSRKSAMSAFFASLIQLSLLLAAATLDSLLR